MRLIKIDPYLMVHTLGSQVSNGYLENGTLVICKVYCSRSQDTHTPCVRLSRDSRRLLILLKVGDGSDFWG